MEYIYRYSHPDNPWVYVGRTNNLKNRINAHDCSQFDNIDRQYEQLLKECVVYFFELKNTTQAVAVESFLIDKYKPTLNKAGISQSDDDCCDNEIHMILPKWKLFIRKWNLDDIKMMSDMKKANKELSDLYNNFSENYHEEDFIKDYINKCIKTQNDIVAIASNIEDNPLFIEYDYDEIKEIYKLFPTLDIEFVLYSCNLNGDYVEYKITKDELLVDGEVECTRKNLAFDIIAKCPVNKINQYKSSIAGLALLERRYREDLNNLLDEKAKTTMKLRDFIINSPSYDNKRVEFVYMVDEDDYARDMFYIDEDYFRYDTNGQTVIRERHFNKENICELLGDDLLETYVCGVTSTEIKNAKSKLDKIKKRIDEVYAKNKEVMNNEGVD